jgi:2-polyprenyl-6-methoxyphenol hydroxylase-like FAD-dependent oxidoreductase
MTMRILISGGGIAGMTLAYWLHRDGHTPVVVERGSSARTGGYGIDFGGTGYDVAARMGIAERLASHQLPVESAQFVDARGNVFASLSRVLVHKISRSPHLGLMHGTLEETLAETIAPNVEIRYGHSIAALDQQPDAVEATFTDGARDTFDVVVGADGVHSRTRELVFGPHPAFHRYLGYQVAIHTIADRFALGAVRIHYTEPGRQLVLYPTGVPGELIAMYLFRSDITTTVEPCRRAQLLREVYGGMGWHTPAVLEQLPASIFMDALTQITMPRWYDRRVVLVGDACGATTPTSAQGVSMAMVGGYLLADSLRAHPKSHEAAFARYQATLRPQVRHRQRNARWFARGLVPATRQGLTAQKILMRVVMREAFTGVLRRQFGADTILPLSETHGPARPSC